MAPQFVVTVTAALTGDCVQLGAKCSRQKETTHKMNARRKKADGLYIVYWLSLILLSRTKFLFCTVSGYCNFNRSANYLNNDISVQQET